MRQANRNTARKLVWVASASLLVLASLVYLLDQHTQRFETLFPFSWLREILAPAIASSTLPAALRTWFPDLAWALVTALFAAELLRESRMSSSVKSLLLILAACSWELLQVFGVVPGVFDFLDFGLSVAAGVLVMLVYRCFMFERDTSQKLR